MPSPQRQSRLSAIEEHCRAHILLLKEEIQVMVDHPVGVAGHGSYLTEVENKLAEVAEYNGMLEAIKEIK